MPQRFIYIVLSCSAYLTLVLSSNLLASPDLRDSTWRKIYQSLRQPRLDDSSYVVRESLRIELPDFEILLVRGELTCLYDSSGSLTGILFAGKAKARFAPRHRLERQQLRRFTRDSVFVSEASIILWRFVQPKIGTWSISTAGSRDGAAQKSGATRREDAEAFWKQLPRQPTKISDYAASLPGYLQTELLQRRGFNLASYLLSSKYSGEESGFVACAFLPDAPRALYPPLHLYLYEPRAHESIQFFRYLEKETGRPFYTLCSYPLEDYFAMPPTDALRLTQYNGWVELGPDGKMTADMGVDIFTAGQKPSALFFQLARDLTVTRITSAFGDTLDFVQEKKEEGLTVLLPKTVAELDTIRLLFHYDGKFLKRHDHGVLSLKDPVYWVPRLNYLRRAVYK
ncbi:MAG: hypothetical protein ONA90_07905, partial [candidate division KSB1 bacterium]|nr:hypothetical protein [candidate division KSB1 bacterium]